MTEARAVHGIAEGYQEMAEKCCVWKSRSRRSEPACKTGETSGGDGGSGPPGGWKLVLSIGGKLRERIKADSGAGCGV